MTYFSEDPEIRAKRYALYIRKSTDDPDKQVRTLDDQRAIGFELAAKIAIRIAPEDVFEDSRSAKRSGNRPSYDQMIRKIKRKEIDGVIAWSPDRLARNMKEAGEIIDLLDMRMIRDLKFAAFEFTNDYNGKMSLGIAFVLAKQYSDKLSVDVTRSIERSFLEGKSNGQFKHGYVRSDTTGLYEPDEELTESGETRFALIRKAWEMRMDTLSLNEIVDFLNNHGYARHLKKGYKAKTPQVQKVTTQKLSAMFKDSFYYGVLVQSGRTIDLRELCDFTPMIQESEWHLVQSLGNVHQQKAHDHEYPFRGLFVCQGCGKNMTCGAVRGSGGYYLSFWCQNKKKGCPSKGSIRAKVLLDLLTRIYDGFETLTEEDYNKYVEDNKEEHKKNFATAFSQKAALKKRLAIKNEELDEFIAANLKKAHDPKEKEVYQKERARQEKLIDRIKKEIEELDKLILVKPLMYGELLNLLKSLSVSLKFASPEIKDDFAKNTILNLQILNGKVVDIRLKEPYASSIDVKKILIGAPGRN